MIFLIAYSLVIILYAFRTIFYKFRYGEYFKLIERLNDYSYIEDAPWINNVKIISLIFVYLFFFYLIFDSYLIAFNYDPLGVLLLSWLTTIIVRSAHYSDVDAGKKISEVVTSFIFPLGIVIMAVYLKNFVDKGFISQIETNLFLFPYGLAIVALSFLLEISLGNKLQKLNQTKTTLAIEPTEPRQISVLEYSETLYSLGTEPKNNLIEKGHGHRTRWENVVTIEQKIDGLPKKIKKNKTEFKIDDILIRKFKNK
jgi:hypothetical protein